MPPPIKPRVETDYQRGVRHECARMSDLICAYVLGLVTAPVIVAASLLFLSLVKECA